MGYGSVVLAAVAALVAQTKAENGAPRVVDPRLTLSRFAAEPDVVTPTGLTVDTKGRVFVVESHTHFRPADYKGPPADRVRVLEDADGDGKAEKVSTFFEGTTYTMGIGFHPNGDLYGSTRNEVFRLTDRDGDGKADGPRETLVRLETLGNYPHNGLSGFAFDPEGLVYFGLGENLGATYKVVGKGGVTLAGGGEGGNVYRCLPDGSGLEKVATGFWNPFAQAFDAFGRLFIVDNDPDSRPPCRLIHVVPGGDYGYRFRNGRKGLHPFTAWNGELPGTLPMAAGTGEAPSGILAYESDNLPSEYIGTILGTSWGDHRIERFRLRPHGASFRSTAEPVVVGGEDFRPVAIATAPDGSVYFNDWVDKSYNVHGKGRVWKLSAKGAPGRVVPADGEAALGSVDRPTRERAARSLGESREGRETLARAVKSHENPRARAAAFNALYNEWVASRAREFGRGDSSPESIVEALRAAARDRSDDVRALAIRRLDGSFVGPEVKPKEDPSPLVRAEHLRRFGYEGGVQAFLEWAVATFSDTDPFLRQAARYGIEKSVGPDFLEGLVKTGTPAERREALLGVRAQKGNPDTVLPSALRDSDPDVRFLAIEWVAEQRFEKYRNAIEEGLKSGSMSRRLFEASLAALERFQGPSKDSHDELAGESYVAALVADPKTPDEVRRRALRMLRPDHPALQGDRLIGFVSSKDPLLRLEAIRTLRDGNLKDRYEQLSRVAADDRQPVPIRAEAVVGLAQDAEARKGLLLSLTEGADDTLRHEALRSLRGVKLSADEVERAARLGRQDAETAALLAFMDGPKASTKSPADEPLADWLSRLEGPGDASAGERIFFHPKGPGCYRCHQVDGRGGRTGPDLSTTPAALTRERLIESIVLPSKEVAPQFVAWLVSTRDGTVFTGTLLEESATGEQIYADAEGRIRVVKAEDVEERKAQTASIMPADLARLMTLDEFRDMLAYLTSRAGR